MMSETNYEALGRYTAAKEQADSLAQERHNRAAEIVRMLKGASIFSGACTPAETVIRFYHSEVIKKVEELAQTNVRLETMIQEANSYATEVGKPQIRIIS